MNRVFLITWVLYSISGCTEDKEYSQPDIPQAGFEISEVFGNTAEVGRTATFLINTTIRPESPVTVSVHSSDPLEGEPTVDTLIFSPDSTGYWVTLVGTNPDIFRGEQDYKIIFGQAQSDDPNYSGLKIADLTMKGVNLSIANPEKIVSFVPGVRQAFVPDYQDNYEGHFRHTLVSGPAGVSVGERVGSIEWIPPDSAQGQTFTIEIMSTTDDGESTFTNSMSVRVLPFRKVEVRSLSGSEYIVTDTTSSIEGFVFSYEASPTNFELREVSRENLWPLRSGRSFFTDGYYAVYDEEEMQVTMQLPMDSLQDDQDAFKLRQYGFDPVSDFWGFAGIGNVVVSIEGRRYLELDLSYASKTVQIVTITR